MRSGHAPQTTPPDIFLTFPVKLPPLGKFFPNKAYPLPRKFPPDNPTNFPDISPVKIASDASSASLPMDGYCVFIINVC